MKKYIWLRVIKSIISVFLVTAIVIAMVFTMINRDDVFKNDQTYRKLRGNTKTEYRYNTLESLGYLDKLSLGEMCSIEDVDRASCLDVESDDYAKAEAYWKDKGYTIGTYSATGDALTGSKYATRDYSVVELVYKYFSKMFNFDHPNKIKDANNPDLDNNRGYYFGTDFNGVPALMCNGCEYKYQIYFNGKFPFIHGNMLKLNFGNSYPTSPGIPTIDVISKGQGSQVRTEQKYETGEVINSADNRHTLRYKFMPDHLDQRKYVDNYATVDLKTDAPSMIGTSYLFGIISLVFAYVLALPWGVAMARNKDKLTDKIGILFINLSIAIPSLALIFFLKYIGSLFGLPDKFPQFGAGNIKSYIMPIIVMTIISMPGLMTWIRRYMIDQSSSDYVKFAKAKGLSRAEISKNHILKNAIIPIVNGIPASIVLQISGAIYTETIFAIPGMGKMLPDAIKSVNNNMIITLTFIFTALSIFSLFAGDLLLTWVDPRISLNAKKGDI
nr:ABC transporter permease [Helcococcus sueciensis]